MPLWYIGMWLGKTFLSQPTLGVVIDIQYCLATILSCVYHHCFIWKSYRLLPVEEIVYSSTGYQPGKDGLTETDSLLVLYGLKKLLSPQLTHL